MKWWTLLSLILLTSATPILPADEKPKERYIAIVKAPFLPVFRERRPESEILLQAKKGDRFVVAQVGEYWARVYVPPNDELGWLELGMETPKVEIVPESDKRRYYFLILNFGLALLALAIVIFMVRYTMEAKRKKALESAGALKEP